MPIIKYPNKILRAKTHKIKDALDPEIQSLIKKMLATMRKSGGLGLAAPQAGKSVRLCIIEKPGEIKDDPSTLYILINPKITAYSKDKKTIEEGCLSFPGKFYAILRPSSVKIRYLDETGKSVKMKAKGILARALQHEIDHLDGILFIDRLKTKK